MTSPTRGGGPEGQDDREGTPPLTKEQIEGHISAMKSIIKDHNKRNKANPIRLNFEIEDQDPNEDRIVKGKEIDDEDLNKFEAFCGGSSTQGNGLAYGANVSDKLWTGRQGDRVSKGSEEAYALRILPLGRITRIHHRLSFRQGSTGDRPPTTDFSSCQKRSPRRSKQPGKRFPKGRLYNFLQDSLTKCPKEILATETQLQLPPPRPVANPLRTGDPDKYCDYHQDKGHHTNDCIQLRKQLEIALESGKLNHLMKDLRQRVERRQNRNPPAQKVINMVNVHSSKKKKRKDREATEPWMNTPISFPPIMTDDASDEPLIIEAEVEGYLVRRVYVDEGSSVEVMSRTLRRESPENVKAGLRET
ncbi:hypothetical protein Tco_0860022 [Tanacetum coccineum]|uniref:Reverse transcriptase domain-containing protein n=1 Tax=Tanacetum coccineum TaxID=301880 RepID=A0ABQ5BDQ5_9ASTR